MCRLAVLLLSTDTVDTDTETLSLHSSCVRVRHMLSDFLVQLPHENGRTNTRPGICTEPLCIRGVCMLGSERQANHDGLSQGAQVSVLC